MLKQNNEQKQEYVDESDQLYNLCQTKHHTIIG